MSQEEASKEYATGGTVGQFAPPGSILGGAGDALGAAGSAVGSAAGDAAAALKTAADNLASIPKSLSSELAYLQQPNLGRRVLLVVGGGIVVLVGLAGLLWASGGKQVIEAAAKAE